ncbi:MAG: PEP-CTERM sorting domain-containing protein [Terriglobales bacterium]
MDQLRRHPWGNWFLGVCLVGLLTLAPRLCQASTITWTLNNVSFGDGGTASGFMTVNYIQAGTLFEGNSNNFDIVITDLTPLPGGGNANFEFTQDNSILNLDSDPIIRVLSNDPHDLTFDTGNPGSDNGNTDITGGNYEVFDSNNNVLLNTPVTNGGQLLPTPEPSSWLLLASGALLLLGVAWRVRHAGSQPS